MRPPKRVTEPYLRRVAAWYLERFEASSGRLRRVLLSRVHRSASAHGTDPEQALPWVEAILADMDALGVVDDGRFAEGVLRRLAARGVARARWSAELRARGVPGAVVPSLLAAWDDEAADAVDPGLVAAARHARRRGWGPWARTAVDETVRRKQALGLMRAGHAPDAARAVLDPRQARAVLAWADGRTDDDACPG